MTVARRDIFETLGRVSVYFSTLEAELSEVLCVLVDREDEMLVATLIEGSTFSRTLDLLKKVARFKDAILEARIDRLLAVVEPLRKKRNSFVHGSWNLSPKLLDQGKVAVSDSRIKFEKSGSHKSWSKGTERKLSYQELQQYQTEVMRALKMTKELLQSLESEAT